MAPAFLFPRDGVKPDGRLDFYDFRFRPFPLCGGRINLTQRFQESIEFLLTEQLTIICEILSTPDEETAFLRWIAVWVNGIYFSH
jgi:hypothetical protein